MKKFCKRRTSAWVISIVILAATVISGGALSSASAQYDYARALQYSLMMYDANMCGTGVEENSRYTWRGDCHVYDAELPLDSTNTNMSDGFISRNSSVLDPDGTGTIDVAGGFHDAGDHVKFGMPQVYSASTLGWGFYEFREQFEELGQDVHTKRILRYFNDYLMKVTFRDSSGDVVAYCYQVGDGDVDHAYWDPPEENTMFRRGWFATEELPSTDCISGAAASLAINYMNFKDEDPQYAEKSLDYAKALFDFAYSNNKEVNDDGPKIYYASSKWEDDYCWAGVWLYLATQDDFYLDEVFKYYDYYAPAWWTHCWNDMWPGTAIIMAQINDKYDSNSSNFEDRLRQASGMDQWAEIDFWSQVELLVQNWMNGETVTITPGGYAFLNRWGSARYNTATQLVALVYDKHNNGDSPSQYSEWARDQMNYLMGDNPNNLSYIVGYNDNSVEFPHHRAASRTSNAEDPSTHEHVLYGALVGGPGENDEHIDVTHDYIYNEVTIDYNTAFVGAAAGLYRFFGDSSMSVTPNFPPDGRELGDSSGGDDDDTPPTILYGDLNGDGLIDSTDITLMGRYILEIVDEFDVPLEAADLNGDGVVDSSDHIILRRYLLEMISEFPVEQ
ncbi:glycoside hydrolase family 9 protein [Herbivorax alkaliphila]